MRLNRLRNNVGEVPGDIFRTFPDALRLAVFNRITWRTDNGVASFIEIERVNLYKSLILLYNISVNQLMVSAESADFPQEPPLPGPGYRAPSCMT
jgi:hypothetical protein